MRFSYIEAMEHYWAVELGQGGLTDRDYKVFGYLVHVSNALRGKNPFQCETKRAALILKLRKEQFARSQRRLERAGLIRWTKGGKGRYPTYEIVIPERNVTGGVTHREPKTPIEEPKNEKSVTESVTLQRRDNMNEREEKKDSLSQNENWFSIIAKHPKWRRVKNADEIIEKFVAEYRSKPHRMTANRLLEWFERERNVAWKEQELPLEPPPPEPKNWDALRSEEFPAESPVHGMSWEETWQTYPDICRRFAGGCDAKRDQSELKV